MIDHKEIKENGTVLEEFKFRFEPKPGEIPELLSDFIRLLGEEKEGVKQMRACLEEFRKWWMKFQNLNVATCKDFERFLFSPDREVIVIQGGESPITSKAVTGETWKESDRPSSSKTVNQDLRKAPNISKKPDCPSSSKTVIPDLPKTQNISKEPDRPSSSKTVCRDQNTSKEPDRTSSIKTVSRDLSNTLKVKIYMGTGWETDFPNLRRDPPRSPLLFLNLTTPGGKIQKTKANKRSWNPSWGKEFTFQLSDLENDELVVKVCDHNDKFAGTVPLCSVFKLKQVQGIHVIPLSCEEQKPCNTARLLMRFTFG